MVRDDINSLHTMPNTTAGSKWTIDKSEQGIVDPESYMATKRKQTLKDILNMVAKTDTTVTNGNKAKTS